MNDKNSFVWSYLKSELTRGYDLNQEEDKYNEKQKNLYRFLNLPLKLEKLMFYGILQLTDCFLYTCTFLPLRILFALCKYVLHNVFFLLLWPRARAYLTIHLNSAQIIDLCKGLVITSCCFVLSYADTSMIYHLIRGQTVIKLYIFFNMLEIGDRLLYSVGQDILDTLFWTATGKRENQKFKNYGLIFHLIVSIVYVSAHALLVLCQTTTLNVAFNSHNKALLTIMLSNNFIELKGSVFRKFDKKNLFQISCSDIRERFHYFIMLLMICVRNMAEFDWDLGQLMELAPAFASIFLSEFFIDWLKHGFILKFNNIPSEVYNEFRISMAIEMMQTKQKNALTDHSDLLSRQMGFIPIPLFCLLYRICYQSIKYSNYLFILNVSLVFLCLITLKICFGIILCGLSCSMIEKQRGKSEAQTKEKQPKIQKRVINVKFNLYRRHSLESLANDCLKREL